MQQFYDFYKIKTINELTDIQADIVIKRLEQNAQT